MVDDAVIPGCSTVAGHSQKPAYVDSYAAAWDEWDAEGGNVWDSALGDCSDFTFV